MFKVSFKETSDTPVRYVTKLGRTTTVFINGTMVLPEFWSHMPSDISNWVSKQKKVSIYSSLGNRVLVCSKGIAKCNPEDKYNTVLGERIAESRAKYRIYKFFYDLCYMLADYYGTILYGNYGPVVDSPKNGIMADLVKYEKLYMKELTHQKELLGGKKHG